jgi:hypothetical protein
MLNSGHIPAYLKEARLNTISKTGQTQVTVNNMRPITILSHILKVMEKAIKIKEEEQGNKLFGTGKY